MKSMNFKAVALSLCMVLGVNMVYGQSDKGAVSTSKHEVRLSASDGLTMGSVSILGMGISDALTGTKRVDDKYSLVYGLGYRYSLNRFRVGADLGFSQSKSKLVLFGEKTPAVKERELNFLVLPTAEFVYYRKGILELYGGAGAGVNLTRHTETGLTEAGKRIARKADLSTSFAYQVNPIALRLGNDRIGGFLEAGLGNKGFLTAGISLRF